MIDQRPLRHEAHQELAKLRDRFSRHPLTSLLVPSLFNDPCTPAIAPGMRGNEWKLTTDWYHGVWHPDVSAQEISEFETPPAWFLTSAIRKTRTTWEWAVALFAAAAIALFFSVPQMLGPWSIGIAVLLGAGLWTTGQHQIVRAMRTDARTWVTRRSDLLDKVVTMDEIGSEHQKDLLFAAMHGSTYSGRQAVWTIAVSLRSLRPLEESWLRHSDLIEDTYLHSTPALKLRAHLDEIEGQMMELWSTIRNSLAALSTTSPHHGQTA